MVCICECVRMCVCMDIKMCADTCACGSQKSRVDIVFNCSMLSLKLIQLARFTNVIQDLPVRLPSTEVEDLYFSR